MASSWNEWSGRNITSRPKTSLGQVTPEGRMAPQECNLQKPVGNVSWAPGMDSPSQLLGTNAVLELLIVAEVGLSCTPAECWLGDKGACFSGSRFVKYLGPELHERGGGVLDNEPVDPSGALEVTLPCCLLDHRVPLDRPV